MKTLKLAFTAAALLLSIGASASQWIRINQIGYIPQATKVAVLMSNEKVDITSFKVVDTFTGEVVLTSDKVTPTAELQFMKSTFRLNFSELTKEGTYHIVAGDAVSPDFPINGTVYNGAADFVLNYMRSQRCGYNPWLRDTCHTRDGFIRYHPTKEGQWIDVTGGWHDAADQLQYTTTTANAIYQMMFAYKQNPEAFRDEYLADGTPGANGIPDIVDEIYWGMLWLDKMNPEPGEFYNQIADDRDHSRMRDDYGYGFRNGRPVYFVTGEPQQRFKGFNKTTGAASTAGKFASDFALGAEVLAPFYPEFAAKIGEKAFDAYKLGVEKPGNCQTVSIVSPYIYEETNWVDDMELGAIELYRRTGDKKYLDDAIEYGRQEPVTPWMGADSALHYQFYPFMNAGHYLVAEKLEGTARDEFIRDLRTGIQRVYDRAKDNPFMYGITNVWCSNNLTTAMITQCILYRQLTGDRTYEEMEGSLRDWLLGCNPWGTSMIVRFPYSGVFPSMSQAHRFYLRDTISQDRIAKSLEFKQKYWFTEDFPNRETGKMEPVWRPREDLTLELEAESNEARDIWKAVYNDAYGLSRQVGGLVDGPVYNTIFSSLIGVHSDGGINYEEFQPGRIVYHNAPGDYSTNEPTMDGTACLTFPFSTYEKEGREQTGAKVDKNIYDDGGIIRFNPEEKKICLVFTAAWWGEGAETIIKTLRKYNVKAGFFFSSVFFDRFPGVVEKLLADGHYVGSHSDGHLLYANYDDLKTRVTKEEFTQDIIKSYEALGKFGISKSDAPYFLPPYEHYNKEVAGWADQLGLKIFNLTPGTRTSVDYSYPGMEGGYVGTKQILANIAKCEKNDPNGLNGYFIHIHMGTVPERTDKLYNRLGEIITKYRKMGYEFVGVEDAIGLKLK